MTSPADEIKSRLDIIEVIRGYVPLRPAGLNFVARCPFHNEKTASFNVSPTKQVWHCFGCGKGGDLFSFIMEIEKISFIEALRLLAPRAGVELKSESGPRASERNRILDLLEQASEFYNRTLLSQVGLKAKEYIKGRGMDQALVENWEIGYASDSWDDLVNFLRSKNFSENEIIKAGLGIKQQGATHVYNRFRARIMFPIREINGNVIGFSGRILPEFAERDKTQGKYVNSPQTIVYDKSHVLFGLDKAKMAIREHDLAIVVEGQMDCVTAHQFDYANVVASSGTALTFEQAMLLKRFTRRVAFAFDMDAAGRQALERGSDQAFEADLEALVVTLPTGKDPDECIRNDFDGWKASITNAKPVIQYYLDEALNEFDYESSSGRRSISDMLLKKIARLSNSVERDFWIKKLSQSINSDEASLREALKIVLVKQKSQEVAEVQKTVVTPPLPPDREEILSEQLLALLLAFPELIEVVGPYIPAEQLSGSSNQALYRQLVVYYNKSIARSEEANSSFSFNEFRSWLQAQDFSAVDLNIIDRLAILIERTFAEINAEDAARSVKEIQSELRRSYLSRRLKAVAKLIGELESQSQNEERDERLNVLLREFNDLAEDLRQLAIVSNE